MTDRDLDALVAENVFGLTVKPICVIDGKGAHDDIGTVSEPYRMADGIKGVTAKGIPFYSTSIAAAWEVVEKLISLGFEVSVDTYSLPEGNGWCVYLGKSDQHEDFQQMESAAPRAICLAALKAIEVKIEK